jgi:hypothetical protein
MGRKITIDDLEKGTFVTMVTAFPPSDIAESIRKGRMLLQGAGSSSIELRDYDCK